VQRFFAGFATASLLWGGVAGALYLGGAFQRPEETALEPVIAMDATPDAGAALGAKVRRRGVRRGTGGAVGSASNGGPVPTGEATTGDSLGEGAARTLDVGASGGEAQLTDAQIERAIGGAMPQVRRCLMLVPGDAPVTGRLVLGVKIAGSGRVSAVNLSGPAAVATGDAGECLRAAVRAVAFPPFDGPEMIAHYPLTLE
jgi:hypothetical protein